MELTTEMQAGKKTQETRIIVCQCGSTKFSEKKKTKTAVVFSCSNCGCDTSVKGNVATVRASQEEVSYAVTEQVTSPSTEEVIEQKQAKAEVEPKEKYKKLRFRILENSMSNITRALEAVRIMNCSKEEYRAQTWQGHALEAISVDFLAGCDPMVLSIIDAQEEAIAIESAKVVLEKGREMTARNKSRLRASIRDDLVSRLGIGKKEEYEPEADPDLQESVDRYEQTKTEAAESEAADENCREEGALAAALRDARGAILEAKPSAVIRIGGSSLLTSFRALALEHGYFLIRASGDERTVTGAGQRPVLYMVGDSFDLDFDAADRYREELAHNIDNAEIDFVELLPSDYPNLPPTEQWEGPEIVEYRTVDVEYNQEEKGQDNE